MVVVDLEDFVVVVVSEEGSAATVAVAYASPPCLRTAHAVFGEREPVYMNLAGAPKAGQYDGLLNRK